MGCVTKTYREWQLSGDEAWLRDMWPQVKKALDYAWVQWDDNRDGVMEGEQHNTYDIEFYGPNSMMGTLYLGALRDGEIMAQRWGIRPRPTSIRKLCESGTKKHDAELLNGDYFIQRYSDSEHAKYQFREGCLSDQLLGSGLPLWLGSARSCRRSTSARRCSRFTGITSATTSRILRTRSGSMR